MCKHVDVRLELMILHASLPPSGIAKPNTIHTHILIVPVHPKKSRDLENNSWILETLFIMGHKMCYIWVGLLEGHYDSPYRTAYIRERLLTQF